MNYWGSVARWVEQLCRNSTFLWMDTVNNGWMDTRLHDAVASTVHGQGSCLVFTHSMGELVFAEAVRRHIIDNPSRGGELWLVRRCMGLRSRRQRDAFVNLTMIQDARFCEMLDSVTHDADRHPAHYCSSPTPSRSKCRATGCCPMEQQDRM